MKKEITTEKVPIKLWLDDIDSQALQQAKNLANLPFVFKHIAIMPDSHVGFGMPIGGVLATTDNIIPNAVGVDIGCGMCAQRTSLKEIDHENLKKIMSKIRELIPVGMKHHNRPCDESLMPKVNFSDTIIVNQEYESALYQIGTLGGGNHFIEIQKGSDGFIWIMIHSGSRNIGYKTAAYYDKTAKNLNEKLKSKVPKSFDLAHLLLDSNEGRKYFIEMNFCLEFAFQNRKLMLENIKAAISSVINEKIIFDNFVNIAHNYAAIETHFHKEVVVHRKGATSAKLNEIGIIPGSQGAVSFIVKGKGNKESFESCSHGAGRKLGRKEAQRTLNFLEVKNKLDKLGIIHSIRSKNDLDEAPSAYKDIAVVMNNQKDLVDIVLELSPLAVVKG